MSEYSVMFHFTQINYWKLLIIWQEVEIIGDSLGFSRENKNIHNISLGQGQEAIAERAIEEGSSQGHWVILQASKNI